MLSGPVTPVSGSRLSVRYQAGLLETVVLASNHEGLAFAVRHGFVEFDRYVLDGETAEYIELYLPSNRVASPQ